MSDDKNCYIVCGCEIMHHGTKQDCIDYFRRLPNPYPMILMTTQKEESIFMQQDAVIVLEGDDEENVKKEGKRRSESLA